MTRTEEKLNEANEHIIRLLTDDPRVDYKKLEELTAGLITKDAKEGNGLDLAKLLYRYNTQMLTASEPKRRGRKKTTTTKKATTKGNGAPAKKRGRPKGSKNKAKTEKIEKTIETPPENQPTE
jgi:hypothetical protein